MRNRILKMALSVAIASLPFATAQGQGLKMPPLLPIETPAQPDAIPLYPKGAPAMDGAAKAERWDSMGSELIVRNVTQPTITPFFPDPAKANGLAVIILPGGAFMQLSTRYEGAEVAKYLAGQGITAFVLKYRLQPTPAEEEAFSALMASRMIAAAKGDKSAMPITHFQPAFDDAVAALKLVRARSADFHIDPKRVGFLGFSAGARNAVNVTVANLPDARPDFLGSFYGPMYAVDVPPNAPPLFAALAMNDPLFVSGDFALVEGWRKAGRSVELHAYQAGSHGFGIHNNRTTTTLWPDQFVAWLRYNGLMK